MSFCILEVALDTPLDATFDYRWNGLPDQTRPMPGQLVLVDFGRREAVGLIVAVKDHSEVAPERLKDAVAVRTQLAPLSQRWVDLVRFAAEYYQRPLGEVALPALPKNLRLSTTVALDRALKKLQEGGSRRGGKGGTRASARTSASAPASAAFPPSAPASASASATSISEAPGTAPAPVAMPHLNAEQQEAADAIGEAEGFAPFLLYGVTGSGKTEVYLHACARVMARDPQAQILLLVPEINLTPQFEANISARFPGVPLATLHSGLAEGERTRHWLAAHSGQARIVLGTRLAILASLPGLRLIVVDEEHDPSYKQQEGLRYSARDLAVWRARQLGIPVVLGSATPSLETWYHSQSRRYRKLELRQRAVRDAVLPKVSMVDLESDKPRDGLSARLLAALRQRLECGEQSLLFLNRRGYAPVLCCEACGWISDCTRCTAHMVLHKGEHRLRCHHCSLELRIPRHCPTCGNVDLQPLGRGTQRVEEGLQALFPQARVLRIDADSTRRKGTAQEAFDSVHRGEVDILVGTQMVAKGHDFKKLTLVGILNPDTALFSHDYRASERLFAQLMQVAGRAGRAARAEGGSVSEVLVQTRYQGHPLYGAVMAHDYDRFANGLLEERRVAGLPPFVFQALLRAEGRTLEQAIAFLEAARSAAEEQAAAAGVVLHDPIPMTLTRVHNVERAQLLLESSARPPLQAFLKEWMATLRAMKAGAGVKWSLEVDPHDI